MRRNRERNAALATTPFMSYTIPMLKKSFAFVLAAFFASLSVSAQNLTIVQEDLRIEQRVDGGFHLFIRKKPDIASVLIAETTKDFTYLADNYAYRAPDWNAVNGDETRLINGVPIARESRIWSLIDSTPEADEHFGQAFHIYIPYILNYGYETGRYGELYVRDGTYFNLRAFTLPYADYRGKFQDNPFILEVTQKPLPGPPDGNYMPDTLQAFSDLSRTTRGEMLLSQGPDDTLNVIQRILEKEKGKSLDVVICLDATGSMKDDIAAMKAMLISVLTNMQAEFPSFRVGMVLYKDYMEEYITRVIPFTTAIASLQVDLNKVQAAGGKDIPEAVHEALYDGATKFPWEAESRLIILIGDAPPHPRPLGRITEQMVYQAATERDIRIDTLVLPQ
jgi:hypothetical protein